MAAFDAVVLAGGSSRRLMGVYKPLLPLAGRPMIAWVVGALSRVASEVLVVVREEWQGEAIRRAVGGVKVVVDEVRVHAPIAGVLAGARASRAKLVFLAACDQPFIPGHLASVLVGMCAGYEACVPRWPNGYVEPLAAAYRRGRLAEAAARLLEKGELRLGALLEQLSVLYVDVYDLCETPEVVFFNVNTPEDYARAAELAERLVGRR